MPARIEEKQFIVRKYDNIEVLGVFYTVEEISFSTVEVGLGSVASGTLAVPTEGAKIEIEQMKVEKPNMLNWILLGIIPYKTAIQTGTANTYTLTIPPATVQTFVGEISQRVRAYIGKEVAVWLTPTGEKITGIDHKLSSDTDPSYWASLIIKQGDTLYLQGVNPYPIAFEQRITLISFLMKVTKLDVKPEPLTTLPAFYVLKEIKN